MLTPIDRSRRRWRPAGKSGQLGSGLACTVLACVLGAMINGCPGASSSDITLVSPGACLIADDCVLAQDRCCQDCTLDVPYVAMSQIEYQQALEACGLSKCGPPRIQPGELECPADHDALAAVCVGGTCERLDLLDSPFSIARETKTVS